MSIARTLSKTLAALALGVLVLSPGFAQSGPPDGSIAINYNRCDGKYEGWGAHLWTGSTPIAGVSWTSPMPPAGTNDFGAYFHAKLSEFSGGKVNYIIHKGDTKDQGGRDMSFDGNATKEIWVNNGDRKIYTSLDDAKKARAAEPCK